MKMKCTYKNSALVFTSRPNNDPKPSLFIREAMCKGKVPMTLFVIVLVMEEITITI